MRAWPCVAYQQLPAQPRDPTSRHPRWSASPMADGGGRDIQRRLLLALVTSRLEANNIAPLACGAAFGERVERIDAIEGIVGSELSLLVGSSLSNWRAVGRSRLQIESLRTVEKRVRVKGHFHRSVNNFVHYQFKLFSMRLS